MCNFNFFSLPVFSNVLYFVNRKDILVVIQYGRQATHYSAESLSWYSRDRLKQPWTPESFHSRFMMAASSGDRSPSSALPVTENSFLASSWK